MKKYLFFLYLVSFILAALCWPDSVRADSCSDWKMNGVTTSTIFSRDRYPIINVSFTITGFVPGDKFIVCVNGCGGFLTKDFIQRDITPVDNTISVSIQGDLTSNDYGSHTLHVRNQNIDPSVNVCNFVYTVSFSDPFKDCRLNLRSETYDGKQWTSQTEIFLSGSNLPDGNYTVNADTRSRSITVSSGSFSEISLGRFSRGNYTIQVYEDIAGTWEPTSCKTTLAISEGGVGPGGEFDPCAEDTTGECEACLGPLEAGVRKHSSEKAWTALGCLPTEPADFVAWLLSAAIKIGGGIAFLLMLYGGFQIMTSTGNPEKLSQGKSIITSAVIGLLFIIFAVLLLKIIGIDIFQLPGFEK